MSFRTPYYWTMGATMLLSVSGFLFWVVAARFFSPDDIGSAGSIFSVTFFLVYLTNLGIPILITRYANDSSERSSIITLVSLVVTSISGIIAGLAFTVVAPPTFLDPLGGRNLSSVVNIVLCVAAVSISTVVDARLIATLQVKLYATRVAFISVSRFVLLIIAPTHNSTTFLCLVAIWPYGISALPFLKYSMTHKIRVMKNTWRGLEGWSELISFCARNFAAQLFLQAPIFATPVLVRPFLSSADYGGFYLTWSVSTAGLILIQILNQTFLAESVKQGNVGQRTSQALTIGVGISLSAAVISIFGGSQVLSLLFGSRFSHWGALMTFLMLGNATVAVVFVAVSRSRIIGRGNQVILISFPYTVLTLVCAVMGAAIGGATGIGIGWSIGGAISLFNPSLWSVMNILKRPTTVTH